MKAKGADSTEEGAYAAGGFWGVWGGRGGGGGGCIVSDVWGVFGRPWGDAVFFCSRFPAGGTGGLFSVVPRGPGLPCHMNMRRRRATFVPGFAGLRPRGTAEAGRRHMVLIRRSLLWVLASHNERSRIAANLRRITVE